MASLTVRNIPDDVMDKVRALAARERRSVNGQILVLLEAGLEVEADGWGEHPRPAGRGLQPALWEQLCGRWEDERSSEEIIADIRRHRTLGRTVELCS